MVSYTTEAAYFGSQSIKVAKTNIADRLFCNETLNLEKGKTYTFSAYEKTSGISNTSGKGAAIFVTYQDSAGAWQTVDSRYASGTNDWQRTEVTFTLPSDAASTTVYAREGIVGESGTAYFDSLQLEDGSVANRYNLIENPDFRGGSFSYWTKNTDCDVNDTIASGTPNASSANTDPYYFKINGSSSKTKNISQNINISGSVGDTFVVSGWAKADSVPINTNRYFALDVGVQGLDGSYQWIVVPFNDDSSDWQYISSVVKTDRAYKSIIVYGIYYNNANNASFDGFRLYKEEFGNSYTYDTNGNLTSSKDAAKQNSNFEYNPNNDLITSTDPKGNNFKYEYDNNDLNVKKHNLTKATSAENVVYSFTYDNSGNPLTSKIGDDTNYINSSAIYTGNDNYLYKLTDALGKTVTNNWNVQKGVLDNVVDQKGKVTSYSYDTLDRLQTVSKTVDGQNISNVYSYENDRLKTITHNGFSYNFGYDSLGNNTTVSVGTQNLITNNYEPRTRKLLESTYGNGQKVSSDYDNLDRIIAKKYNGNTRYTYEYDSSGNIGFKNDIVNGVSYRYIYDISDRPTQIKDSSGNLTAFAYDPNSNISIMQDYVNGNNFFTFYGYDKDNRLNSITYTRATSNTVTPSYDNLGRLKERSINTGAATYNTVYAYKPGVSGTGSTSTKVDSITNNGNAISYTYDDNGNIETITQNGQVITYQYNEANEVIRENNQVLNKTITTSYDAGGNIQNKTEYPYTEGSLGTATLTISYVYEDTNWKDKLTSYNGKAITYDAIGNPLTYDGLTYTWEEGRQLQGISGNGNTISYKYNDAGIRTQKTVNGVTTNYHLVGNKVTYETNGTDTIYYTYDSSDNLVSMDLDGVEYYYIRNAQGDIIGLFDKNGAAVASYTYDTWGKLISIKDGSGTDITYNTSSTGYKNPYRYRGYRYDSETGMYFLQSRYYNPDWGRFINADAVAGQVGELLGHNIFAYCKNNPVNMSDPNGFGPKFDTEEEEAEYYQWQRSQRGIPSNTAASSKGSSPIKMIATNTINGMLDKGAATVAARYIKTGLKYSELGFLTLGKYIEKNPIGKFIKTTTGKIGISSLIGIFVSAHDNVNEYGFTWGATGRIGIDTLFIVGAVSATILIPGVGFVASIGIGVIAEAGSRATKNIIYGDDFWK